MPEQEMDEIGSGVARGGQMAPSDMAIDRDDLGGGRPKRIKPESLNLNLQRNDLSEKIV